jgi:16S rRNA (cytidine1402-2'-O)-methyltransferase
MPLFLVATPLGNLSDLSPRAVETLRSADILAAEDTRSAQRLLAGVGIPCSGKKIFSHGDHNERHSAPALLEELRAGRSVAIISEGGTPLISDPGFRLVRAALEAGIAVTPIPGPCAAIAALTASGLPVHAFSFFGFPPRKPGAQGKLLEALKDRPETLLFYESPYRVARFLARCSTVFGPSRRACVARELTKFHEEFVRGTLGELAERYLQQPPKGECTLVIAGHGAANFGSHEEPQG